MLAVGIIAFVLSAILGLVSVAVQGTKEANLNVRLGLIEGRVASTYRSQSRGDALTNLLTTYYTYDGVPTNETGGYFRCDITNASPAGFTTNMAMLKAVVRWPNPQLTSTNAFVLSVGNYQ